MRSTRRYRLPVPVAALVCACMLTVVACGDDDVADTTNTTIATTTTAAPTTTTTATEPTRDVTVTVEVAAVYDSADDGSCAGAATDGEDFGYLAAGSEVAVTALDGSGTWTGALGPGSVTANDHGLEVCVMSATVSGVPESLNDYTYALAADDRGIAGSGAPAILSYPHGLANGLGYQIVDWQLYGEGVPIWYTDVARSPLIQGDHTRSEDFLFGVGFAPPTGGEFVSPFDDGVVSYYGGPRLTYNSDYPEADFDLRYADASVGTAPHQDVSEGIPGPDDTGIWVLSTAGNLTIPFTEDLYALSPVGRGEPFAVVGDAHDQLVIVRGGVEVILAFSHGSDDGYDFEHPQADPAVLEYFPYLESALAEPPQFRWDIGLTFVTGPDCADCSAIEVALGEAPEGLPIHLLTLDDRVVWMYAIREAPYLAAVAEGSFDIATASGADALEAVPELIEKACGWSGTC